MTLTTAAGCTLALTSKRDQKSFANHERLSRVILAFQIADEIFYAGTRCFLEFGFVGERSFRCVTGICLLAGREKA